MPRPMIAALSISRALRGTSMRRPRPADICIAEVAPGLRCGHRVEDHLLHGPALLECWRCEDWHHFVMRPRPNAA